MILFTHSFKFCITVDARLSSTSSYERNIKDKNNKKYVDADIRSFASQSDSKREGQKSRYCDGR